MHGPHPVLTDGRTWYPLQTCRFFKTASSHSFLLSEKHYRKDDKIHKGRTVCFDDYFPCKKKKLQIRAYSTMDESVCQLLEQRDDILTLQSCLKPLYVFIY